MIDNLVRARSLMGSKKKIFNENLLIRFFKFLITKLPGAGVTFNIKKGRVFYNKQ